MSLSIEWRNRIECWQKELANHFYIPLGNISVSGFTTFEQLIVDEAKKKTFRPMPEGTPWGAKWEYGWFRAELVLPEEAEGKRIVVSMNVGGESAIYINGKNAGARDSEHVFVTLCEKAVAGQKYEIMVESYAGHGLRECHALPNPPGRINIPEPPETQVQVGQSSFGIWQEEAYQLWIDVETLKQIRDNIEPQSLRVSEIDKALKDFTLIVDFEQPYEEMINSFKSCRDRLKPLLECKNGSTSPTLFVFGHSHIDVAWLWPLAETERKCTRTFATQMALMEEYPEYKFLQSQPHLYWMMKNHYPDLYERIKEKIAKGQIIPEGGMWVEADTNITGGESLIRQFLYGKKFFRDEFGVECELLWLPDVFGYSGALPQIMKGCGIKYFSTQKILWNYNGGDRFPYNTFIWEGIDGSEIISHIHYDYNAKTEPKDLISRWNDRIQKDDISTFLYPFGYGDGGGGATRDHLEYLRRATNLEGVPKTRMCNPVEFFKDLEQRGIPPARYVGELYFQAHRGTYTSQAKTKKGNRKSEFALREAELWAAAASVLKGNEYAAGDMQDCWRTVLLNQFHDIIPGSSIHRVYEEANAAYEKVINKASEIVSDALSTLSKQDKTIAVFNSLSWKRNEIVELPEDIDGLKDYEGNVVPVQKTEGRSFAEISVPSCGFTTLYPCEKATVESQVKAGERSLENELIKIEFNEKGEITSILDKQIGKNWAKGLCNSFRMYKDVTTLFDAWDIDSMYEQLPVPLEDKASFRIIANGPLFAVLEVERKLNNSFMKQQVIIKRNSRRVDFKTTIDWQETHKLLKVSFDVDIHANEAIHEIQFGHLARPTHRSRQFDADRFEVCAHKWSALMEENRGFAVLNDCKYGISALGSSLNLTLLKSAIAPDMTADKGIQEFTYSFYAWNGCFAESDVIKEAYALNSPAVVKQGDAGHMSLFEIDAPNVIIETVKLAEDGSGDIIVRLYESKRMWTKCTLKTSLPVARAYFANMLEDIEKETEILEGAATFEIKPFEIKTIRLIRKN